MDEAADVQRVFARAAKSTARLATLDPTSGEYQKAIRQATLEPKGAGPGDEGTPGDGGAGARAPICPAGPRPDGADMSAVFSRIAKKHGDIRLPFISGGHGAAANCLPQPL